MRRFSAHVNYNFESQRVTRFTTLMATFVELDGIRGFGSWVTLNKVSGESFVTSQDLNGKELGVALSFEFEYSRH